MNNVLIIGSNSGIGVALADKLSTHNKVFELSRSNTNYSEQDLEQHFSELQQQGSFKYIINCIGVLHDERTFPEKRLNEVNAEKLMHYYHINAVLPALSIKYFHSLLDKKTPSVFATLSAMVGSIGDNKLGGWYGYRSSKAALNMLIKTSSIEINRTNKQASLIAIHPGTTNTDLSKPFQSNIKGDKLYTKQQTAQRIIQVLESIKPENTGQFYNWDGNLIQW